MYPLHSQVSPTKGKNIRSGYPTPAFSGAQKRVELLRAPCILRDPQCEAQGQNEKWLPHPCLLEGQKRAQLLRNSYIAESRPRQAEGRNQKWLRHPYLLGGAEEGGIAT